MFEILKNNELSEHFLLSNKDIKPQQLEYCLISNKDKGTIIYGYIEYVISLLGKKTYKNIDYKICFKLKNIMNDIYLENKIIVDSILNGDYTNPINENDEILINKASNHEKNFNNIMLKIDTYLQQYHCPVCDKKYLGDELETRQAFAVHLDEEQQNSNIISDEFMKKFIENNDKIKDMR